MISNLYKNWRKAGQSYVSAALSHCFGRCMMMFAELFYIATYKGPEIVDVREFFTDEK